MMIKIPAVLCVPTPARYTFGPAQEMLDVSPEFVAILMLKTVNNAVLVTCLASSLHV